MGEDCKLSILYRRVCFSITSLLSIFLSHQDRFVVGINDVLVLDTYCPTVYTEGEVATVICRNNFGADLFRGKCLDSSQGMRIFNGSELLGSSNCNFVNGTGLADCPPRLTKKRFAYPTCECEKRGDDVIYKVAFLLDKMYHQGNSFSCDLDCMTAEGKHRFAKKWNGYCLNITVECGSSPNCMRCIQPGFKPLDCVECLPGFEGPNCTEAIPTSSPSALTTAGKVGVVGGAVAGTAMITGAGAYLLDVRKMSNCSSIDAAQYAVDAVAEVEIEGVGEGEEQEEDNEENDDDPG